MNRAQNHQDIKRAIQDLIKIDRYNLIGINPDYYNELLERKSSPPLLLFSSFISTSDALVIIRNSEGNAIYNNEQFINYLGVNLVNYSVAQACERFPDYRTCIDLDKELLNSDACFIVSNETVDTGNGKQYFHTYRQKIIHFNQAFIICNIEAYFLAKQLRVSFSYGIVEVGDNIASAINQADEAMYKQKNLRKQKHLAK